MEINLATLIEDACQRFSEETFLAFPQGEGLVDVTYSDFLRRAQAWAERLREMGVQRGDRVGIITPKSPNQVFAFYACWWLGAIAVPICEMLGDLEMGFIIRDCEPGLVLVDRTLRDRVDSNSIDDIRTVTFDEMPPLEAGPTRPIDKVACDPDDVAALIYTSGSTGMPKGVMLSHRNFCANSHANAEVYEFGTSDRMVSLLPYWHSYALVCELITMPLAGAATVIPRDKRDFKRNIKLFKPTIILVVPRIADAMKSGIEKRIAEASPTVQRIFSRAIHNAARIFTAGPRLDGGLLRMAMHHVFYDLLVFRKIRRNFGGNLRFFVSGGAPLDIEHQIFFKYVGLPIYQGYGLTESTPVISGNLPERHRIGSSGPLLPWLKAERGGDYTFMDAEGNLDKRIRGELLVRGDCVMKGYWRHTDASAKTLADGWLHTGDMGYVDEDGFLFIDGRRGNMLVLIGGEKIHPEHVEDAVKTLELVTDAMVIGEKCKNVYVLVNVDAERADGFSEEEILKEIRTGLGEKMAHLAAYQKPKDVLVLPEFSMDDGTLTVTLKVRRHSVWEKYGDRIREFLKVNGEDIATRQDVSIDSSKIMEDLGRE